MAQLGEIKRANDIGLKGSSKYIWAACVDCGKERWIQYLVREAKGRGPYCQLCGYKKSGRYRRGEANHFWRGGKRKRRGGYIQLWISPDDFFYPMANKEGYVFEHRLVVAKRLGRCLASWELIHHKNGVKADNRWENLEMTTKGGHALEHNKGYRAGYQKGLVDGRDQQIRELRDEIKLLQWQTRELTKQLQGSA